LAEPLTINVQDAPGAAPAAYTVPGSVEVEPLSAFAHYDGSAAAAPFLAALTFYSASGSILARVFPTTQISAGGTADVTFAPFLDEIGAGGIQLLNPTSYSGDLNEGEKLEIFTTGNMDFFVGDTNGVGEFKLSAKEFIFLDAYSGIDLDTDGGGGGITLTSSGAGTISLSVLGTGDIRLDAGSAGRNIILVALPVAAGGLPAGALWNNGGVVNIV
jgi:hypothetical protein